MAFGPGASFWASLTGACCLAATGARSYPQPRFQVKDMVFGLSVFSVLPCIG